MERDCKMKKTNTKTRESFEERSPLQNLNGLPIHRRNTKKSSHISSSSAHAASRSLLSDNTCSSSSSRTDIYKKQYCSSNLTKNEPDKSRVRTSNETPRKPFLQTSRKEKPRSITQRDAKPTCKNRQRSKLLSVQGKSEKGSEEFQEKMKNPDDNGSDDSVYEGGDASADVKTPPVEASLSPEIQCQSKSRMHVLKSAGTPVCYGAGYLVSGVSDRRKSKRRGSLKGGPEKGILFSDAGRDENVSVDLQESSIPLLAEASVRWHLSTLEDFGDRLDQVCDDDSATLDLLSLPSMLCGNTLDFLCGESSYSGSGRVRNVSIDRRNSDAIFSSSPRKATDFPRILESLRCNMDESLLGTSPKATYSCNGISSTEGKRFSKSPSRDNSILSLGSLDSGNIIQTPDSDSCFGRSRLEAHLSNCVWPELDSITETLERVKLSHRSEVLMWDAPGLGSHVGSPLDPKNVDSVSSWVSDATSDNLALSQMRISWCEGLASKVVGTDEFDCCCCLSDEERETDRVNNSGRMVVASGFRVGNELSPAPVLLDYEPCLDDEGKGKSFSLRTNACAESICTDGGGLLASDDSDWTYFLENRSFHVT